MAQIRTKLISNTESFNNPFAMIPILDTHLHLLYQEKFAYDWCADLPALNQDFKIETYQDLIDGHGVSGSIFMEVDIAETQITDEAAFFSNLVTQSNNPLMGVIAACRPEQEDFQHQLESTLTDSVCGLRRVLHTMPDELSQAEIFRENIRSLVQYNLPFDLCFLERQLPLAYELAKACPEIQFVLDHCGIPTIAKENFGHWKSGLEKVARLPNVVCKVSGIIAYSTSPEEATLETLRPWLETTVETFGPDRIVFGTDWPVCNLTQGLPAWLTMARAFFSSYSEDEQHAIFHCNAESIYNIRLL
jgi:predicted TIM-barrel fold metal-dependent hydrolase